MTEQEHEDLRLLKEWNPFLNEKGLRRLVTLQEKEDEENKILHQQQQHISSD